MKMINRARRHIGLGMTMGMVALAPDDDTRMAEAATAREPEEPIESRQVRRARDRENSKALLKTAKAVARKSGTKGGSAGLKALV
jgi:erythromycin esterase-like protein